MTEHLSDLHPLLGIFTHCFQNEIFGHFRYIDILWEGYFIGHYFV